MIKSLTSTPPPNLHFPVRPLAPNRRTDFPLSSQTSPPHHLPRNGPRTDQTHFTRGCHVPRACEFYSQNGAPESKAGRKRQLLFPHANQNRNRSNLSISRSAEIGQLSFPPTTERVRFHHSSLSLSSVLSALLHRRHLSGSREKYI